MSEIERMDALLNEMEQNVNDIKSVNENTPAYFAGLEAGDKIIKVNNYICSDISQDLINLWNMIKDNPSELCESYKTLWTELNAISDIEEKKKYYYEIREKFNKFKKKEI